MIRGKFGDTINSTFQGIGAGLRTLFRIKTFIGTSLTIQNTVNAPIERLIIDGASSQVGTPTPTAPIAITNVVNPKLLIYRKNDYGGGIINANPSGSSIVSNSATRIIYIPCLPNTNYTVSKLVSSRFQIFETQLLPANGVGINNIVSDATEMVLTAKTGANAQYLCVYLYNSILDTSIALQTLLDSVRIEVGLTSRDITNLTATLRSLPNGVKDRLIINKATQTAWIERNVGSVVLNGSENWDLSGTTRYFTLLSGSTKGTGTSLRCSHFTFDTILEISIGRCRWGTGNEGYFVLNYDNGTGGTAAFKTWLASNNVAVKYQLATPTTESIAYPSINTIQSLTNISKSGIASNIEATVIILGG